MIIKLIGEYLFLAEAYDIDSSVDRLTLDTNNEQDLETLAKNNLHWDDQYDALICTKTHNIISMSLPGEKEILHEAEGMASLSSVE